MEFKKDGLLVKIFKTRSEMGKAAADDIAECIKKCLSKKPEINMIFAAAPSQNDMLSELLKREDIEWGRINAYHMDEYIGLSSAAPQCFSNFLRERIFDLVPFGSVNCINPGAKSPEAEAERYGELLRKNPPDIVCMGIGENGHIAFNDPHVADFEDKKIVKTVELDKRCRMQQVNDGCFADISEVPRYALTLTIPTLMAAEHHFCVVPAPTKAEAVRRCVTGEVGEDCPATILRRKDNAVLYCDADSSRLLREEIK